MQTNLNNAKTGDLVEVSGMVHNVRVTKWGGFVILRKARGLLQAVVQNETSRFFDEQGQEISLAGICREMAVTIRGTVGEAKIKDPAAFYKTIEIAISELHVLSRPSTTEVVDMNALKFGDEETMLRYKFDNRQVTLRNPRDMAILKVASVVSKAFADYLTEDCFRRCGRWCQCLQDGLFRQTGLPGTVASVLQADWGRRLRTSLRDCSGLSCRETQYLTPSQ